MCIKRQAGIGYDLISTEKHNLKSLLSLGYASQKYEDGGSEDYPNLRLDINYVWKILENLKFKEDFNYQTSLTDTSLYYVNSDSSVQVKINTHFSLGVGLKIAYQNKPPTDDIKKTDTTFLTSLIVDY
jgi:putative salt-induced outer membrane protein